MMEHKELYEFIDYINEFVSSHIVYSTSPIYKKVLFSLEIKETDKDIVIKTFYTYTNVWNFEEWQGDIQRDWFGSVWEKGENFNYESLYRWFRNATFHQMTYGRKHKGFKNILQGLVPLDMKKFDLGTDYKRSDTISYIIYKETITWKADNIIE
jgi:hypothetical protein